MKNLPQNMQNPTDRFLDDLDKKILYYLDLDSRQSLIKLARKVKSNKDTVHYRVHKLVENKIITRFSTATNTAYLGYENIKVYLQFQNLNEEKEKEFFTFLRSIPRIGWIVRSSGRWDALFCYWAESKFEFYKIFIQIMNKFSKYIYHKEVIHNINWFYYNRKWLLPKELKKEPIKYGEEPHNEKIDELDKQILHELIKHAKIPIKDIAIKTKNSSQNIINRIRKLQQRGIITKFSIDLHYGKLGLMFCKTCIYLDNITKERLTQFYEYCAKEQKIFALTTTLGAWDVELEFEVHQFEEMVKIMDKIKNSFGDIVRSYESIIITKQSEVIYVGE